MPHLKLIEEVNIARQVVFGSGIIVYSAGLVLACVTAMSNLSCYLCGLQVLSDDVTSTRPFVIVMSFVLIFNIKLRCVASHRSVISLVTGVNLFA